MLPVVQSFYNGIEVPPGKIVGHTDDLEAATSQIGFVELRVQEVPGKATEAPEHNAFHDARGLTREVDHQLEGLAPDD